MFRPRAPLLLIGHVGFLVLLPLFLFLLHEAYFLLIHVVSSDDPDTEKERGTAVAVAIAISH